MGNSDDILLYFDIRHYDMNMPYTCLMSHISIADQWLLSNTKWKSFRIQCILMKDIMWSLPANVLKTFWNTSLHFNISFCHAALFFLRHHWGGRDSSSITKSQYTSATILLCSIAVTVLETNLTQKLCSSSPTNVCTFTAVIHFRSPFVWHLLTEEESTCDSLWMLQNLSDHVIGILVLDTICEEHTSGLPTWSELGRPRAHCF